jgi:hypothetical protein
MMISVIPIKYEDAIPMIKRVHYAKRKCHISHSFGAYNDKKLIGIITYGIPASHSLCKGICGDIYSKNVLELNRLCCESKQNLASIIISQSLKMLPKPSIIVSYADTGKFHIGYVYQSTNFIYTGLTDSGRKTPRSDRISDEKKHGRHQKDINTPLKYRSPKHRYIYFVATSLQRKRLIKNLKYPILSYPKGDSKKYMVENIEYQQLLF